MRGGRSRNKVAVGEPAAGSPPNKTLGNPAGAGLHLGAGTDLFPARNILEFGVGPSLPV